MNLYQTAQIQQRGKILWLHFLGYRDASTYSEANAWACVASGLADEGATDEQVAHALKGVIALGA